MLREQLNEAVWPPWWTR